MRHCTGRLRLYPRVTSLNRNDGESTSPVPVIDRKVRDVIDDTSPKQTKFFNQSHKRKKVCQSIQTVNKTIHTSKNNFNNIGSTARAFSKNG